MISRQIGRYEIDRLLGEGGVGRVYAARDTLLGRQVAIKTLRPEASRNRDFLERFINEAKSFGDLRHVNITALYDLDLSGQPWI
jgi:serine/threonine-protein kinase